MNSTARLFRTALFAVFAVGLFTITAAAASVGVGTVTGDALRLRAEPGTQSNILATAGLDERVIVLEDTGSGWYRVDYKTTVGYMSADYLKVETRIEADLGWGVVDTEGDPLNLRSGPGTSHEKVTAIPAYATIKLTGIDNGWYSVSYNGKVGYVSSDYILLAKDETGARSDSAAVSVSSLGARIVELAKSHLGKRYVYGGKGPNVFDCSGFTLYVYSQVGISLPAGATQQYYHSGTRLANRFDAQPGDLIFINNPQHNGGKAVSHVGIYIGDGKYIHASTNSYTVRIDPVFTGHYANHFIATNRVAN